MLRDGAGVMEATSLGSVGEEPFFASSNAAKGVAAHSGTVKVGMAVMPVEHSTQVL